MNRYAYTGYDPVNYVDPSGFFFRDAWDWFSNGVKDNPISFVTGVFAPMCFDCWAVAGILERSAGESVGQGAVNGIFWGGVGNSTVGVALGVAVVGIAELLAGGLSEDSTTTDDGVNRAGVVDLNALPDDPLINSLEEQAARAGEVPYGEGYRGSSVGADESAVERAGGQGAEDSVRGRTTSERIAAAAEEAYQAQGPYGYDDTSGCYPAGTNKCNVFVYDVLEEAEAQCPGNRCGQGAWPPDAATWARGYVDGWVIVDTPQSGDVVAQWRNYANASGHMGVVVTGPAGEVMVISARPWGVTREPLDSVFPPASSGERGPITFLRPEPSQP